MLSRILPTPSDIPQEATASFRENIRIHLIDGSFYVLGMSLVSVQTILPVFIKELGGSSIAIGSVQVLWIIGQYIPSIVMAYFLRRQIVFKSAMVKLGLVHRLMLLVCGIAVFALVGKISAEIAVPIFLILIFFIPSTGSIAGLPWFQVFTKTVPVRLRGRLLGVRQLIGSAGGVLGGTMVGIILSSVIFPKNFAMLFVLAFIFTMISFYYLSRITETPSQITEGDDQQFNIFRQAKVIIIENINYRRFLFADIFVMMSLSASSFYSVYALEKFSLSPSYVGTFTGIVMVTNIVANILFGITADMYGHRINLIVFAVSSALAGLFAVISTNILMYGFVFFFIACATQIQAISRLSFIAEMSREHERLVYIGLTNLISAPAVLIGIVFGGLVPVIGYRSIFTITSLLAVISFLILYKFVIEPRK